MLGLGKRETPAVAFVKRNDKVNINPIPKGPYAVSTISMQGENDADYEELVRPIIYSNLVLNKTMKKWKTVSEANLVEDPDYINMEYEKDVGHDKLDSSTPPESHQNIPKPRARVAII